MSSLNAAFDALQEWVRDQLGISFAREQRNLFVDRINGLCRDQALTPERLLEEVRCGDSQAMLAVAEVVSTNYTFFFREPESSKRREVRHRHGQHRHGKQQRRGGW